MKPASGGCDEEGLCQTRLNPDNVGTGCPRCYLKPRQTRENNRIPLRGKASYMTVCIWL